MKYGVFDQDGKPHAFYAKEVNGDDIPAEAVPITDAQWQALLDNLDACFIDGQVIVPPPQQTKPAEPEPVARDLFAEIDALTARIAALETAP